ncbi:MAG: GTP 3',8-cyclase MoaA [Methanobacteriota archaeon]|nr:MAG: GTP 3',8-cyclase MoaA [Euryarchaeota archaeon]
MSLVSGSSILTDKLGRKLQDLRISVTDRCNFRCKYCMPREIFDKNWQFLEKNAMLSFEEILEVVDSFVIFGLKKIRLTGGEPLLRKDLEVLIHMIKSKYPKLKIALTTNGSLLKLKSLKLKNSGLDRITISLDSLDPLLFQIMNDTKIPLAQILEGINHAIKSKISQIKINCVVKKGVNENQIIPLIEYFKDKNVTLRFIEFMDVGNSNNWDLNHVLTRDEILRIINEKYNFSELGREKISDVAEQFFDTKRNQKIEIISSISKPFCSNCTRARLSSEGKLYTCLFGFQGFDLKRILREGGNLVNEIKFIWNGRDDRFSELRTEHLNGPRKIEMSYIGG